MLFHLYLWSRSLLQSLPINMGPTFTSLSQEPLLFSNCSTGLEKNMEAGEREVDGWDKTDQDEIGVNESGKQGKDSGFSTVIPSDESNYECGQSLTELCYVLPPLQVPSAILHVVAVTSRLSPFPNTPSQQQSVLVTAPDLISMPRSDCYDSPSPITHKQCLPQEEDGVNCQIPFICLAEPQNKDIMEILVSNQSNKASINDCLNCHSDNPHGFETSYL